MDANSRIIVALDCDSRAAAEGVVDRIGDGCRFYKVGLELLTAGGPEVVRGLVARGKQVFLDLKLFEIPTSVAGAVRAAGELGVSMVTVHGMGGTGIMSAAVDAARDHPGLRILALTVVTSMTDGDLADIGVGSPVDEQVLRLAGLAREAGCHGVIASPRDVAARWAPARSSSPRASRCRASPRPSTPAPGPLGPPSTPVPRMSWSAVRSLVPSTPRPPSSAFATTSYVRRRYGGTAVRRDRAAVPSALR